MIDNISETFGMLFFAVFILVMFVLGIMLTGRMFLNIYRKLIGIRIRKMDSCRSCGHSISSSAIICPNCGENYGKINGYPDSIIFCFLLGFGLIGLAFNSLSEFLEMFEGFSFLR